MASDVTERIRVYEKHSEIDQSVKLYVAATVEVLGEQKPVKTETKPKHIRYSD